MKYAHVLVAGTAVWAACLAGCSSDAPTRSHEPLGGTGGAAGAAGIPDGGGAAPSTGAICEPVSTEGCAVKVVGGPASGAECLAMRDNEGANHVQLRQTWTHITAPVGNTIDLVYRTLRLRAELPLAECNMLGVSGYIKLLDWDRSDSTITNQTARVGWADFAGDGPAAVKDGLCMVELDYSAPALGLTEPWLVRPVVQKRVAADFQVTDALRNTIPAGEGIFYFDETTRVSHHYSPLEHVAIFDNALKLAAVPLHDAEMTIRFNDDTLNCAGRYRADALTPAEGCKSQSQTDPTWGCATGGCPPGEGPVETKGYFLITELEQIYSTVLDSTLCVSYPGQQNSIAAGWANPSDPKWGLTCSGSPNWDPTDPVNGLPMGDYCSSTHTDSTVSCHDAYKSSTFATMAGFPIQASACHSDAIAAAKGVM